MRRRWTSRRTPICVATALIGAALACGGPVGPPVDPPPPPAWPHLVQPVAEAPKDGLVALAQTPWGLIGASERQIWRMHPEEPALLATSEEPVLAVITQGDRAVWATWRGIRATSRDGHTEPLVDDEIRAVATAGDRLVWATPGAVWLDGEPPVRISDANVLEPSQLAASEERVAWIDHNAGDVWVAPLAGSPERVAVGQRSAHSLSIDGDRVSWVGAEADLLPGRAAGVHLARRAVGWVHTPLALSAERGATLTGECLVAPGRCARLDATAWTDIDDRGATDPLLLTGDQALWVVWEADGTAVVATAPRGLCCDEPPPR